MSKQYLQTYTTTAHPTDIFSLAVTPSHLISASGSSSLQIRSTKGQIIHADTAEDEDPYPLAQTLEKVHPLGCHHVCASEDGKVAASAGFGGEVKIWEYEQEDNTWKARGEIKPEKKSAGEHWALALSSNGQHLAATTHDGRINVYDTTDNPGNPSKITSYQTKGSFGLALDLSSDGNLTASGHQNGTIHLFNNTTRSLAHNLSGLIKPVRTVKFSPASTFLGAAGDSRIIALYDTASGQQVAVLSGHQSWVMSLSWNWSGEFLLSGAYDGKAKVWSVERRECVATQTEGDGGCLWAVRWLPQPAAARRAETFVTAGKEGRMAFYREASGT